MHNHTGCICLTFLRCVFSNVSSRRLHKRMQNHTGCIYLIFHWQLFHWNFSAWNYHAQGFVPSPTIGKVCPLLLLVLNWENSNLKLIRKRKWKWNEKQIQKDFVLFRKDRPEVWKSCVITIYFISLADWWYILNKNHPMKIISDSYVQMWRKRWWPWWNTKLSFGILSVWIYSPQFNTTPCPCRLLSTKWG